MILKLIPREDNIMFTINTMPADDPVTQEAEASAGVLLTDNSCSFLHGRFPIQGTPQWVKS